MLFLRKLCEFYVYGNIHVAIAVWSLTMVTGFFYRINTANSALFIGLSTFVAYNWIRYLKYRNASLQETILIWFNKHKKFLVVLNSIASIYLFLLLFKIKMNSLWVLMPFALMTLFYITPIQLTKNKKIALRKIPIFKIFCISLSWSGLVVLFPLTQEAVPIDKSVLLFFVQQFIFVFVLTLPFDIRDVKFDEKTLKTIPQLLGINKTRVLGVFATLVFFGISFYLFSYENMYSVLFIGVLQLFYLVRSGEKKSRFYASFWVESVPIVWFLILKCFGS